MAYDWGRTCLLGAGGKRVLWAGVLRVGFIRKENPRAVAGVQGGCRLERKELLKMSKLCSISGSRSARLEWEALGG